MIERGTGQSYDAGERLPWLEPVEEVEETRGPSMGKMIGLVLLGILLLGAIVGGYSWWSQQGATSGGSGELIAAPAEPYKIKPEDPGGMEVEGEGDTSFAASEGAEPQGKIDVAAVPEAPLVAEEEAAAPASGASKAGSAGTIQLGAFSSEASANSAWKALSTRFKYLEPLTHSILEVKSGDKTLYRLRASGPDAASLCGRLRVAGETCLNMD